MGQVEAASFPFLRVPMSQNDCFMKVKLSVFGVHRVRVMALSRPPHVKTVQDFAMIYENFDDVFIICYIKVY